MLLGCCYHKTEHAQWRPMSKVLQMHLDGDSMSATPLTLYGSEERGGGRGQRDGSGQPGGCGQIGGCSCGSDQEDGNADGGEAGKRCGCGQEGGGGHSDEAGLGGGSGQEDTEIKSGRSNVITKYGLRLAAQETKHR